jgi:hypothetical protein
MKSIASQFRTVTPILLISYLLVFLSLLLIIILSTYKDIPLDTFTQDPTALMNAPFYLGAFSSIGIMLWSGSTVLCLFTAFMIRQRSYLKEDYQFLIVSGFITLLLAFDDMFLLHEEVLPHFFHIPANAVIVTYVNIFVIYLILFRRKILSTDFIVLLLAFFLLGLSTVIDLLPLPLEKDSFLEDAIKLFGVVSWFIYFWRQSRYLAQLH